MWGRGPRGNKAACSVLSSFQSLPLLLTNELCPSGADSWVGGLFLYILGSVAPSNRLSCETGNFSHCRNLHKVFRPRSFEAFFSSTGTVGCMVCLAPQLFFLVYPLENVWLPCLPTTVLPCFLSAPPTSLDECFFFNSLVVRLPHSLIFLQFWLFFGFKLVIILLLFVWGSKAYLSTPPSWLEARSSWLLMWFQV